MLLDKSLEIEVRTARREGGILRGPPPWERNVLALIIQNVKSQIINAIRKRTCELGLSNLITA